MNITLEVELSGLCFYLIKDKHHVALVMPDARKAKDGRPRLAADGDIYTWHVGYVRFDMADAFPAFPELPGRRSTPGLEGIRRFDNEELAISSDGKEAPDPTSDPEQQLRMPNVAEFAPNLRPKAGLFSADPPAELLMRARLENGVFEPHLGDGEWVFNDTLNTSGRVTNPAPYAGYVKWTKTFYDATTVFLDLNDWSGARKVRIPLTPRKDGTIRLKIANLCSDNPMEWPEMFMRPFRGKRDEDFKWFYTILEDQAGSLATFPKDGVSKLPVPELASARGGGPDDCTGGGMLFDYETLTAASAAPAATTNGGGHA